MTIKNAKNFWAGIMFAALGVFFIVFAQENEMGTAAHMRPAYFPTLLGGILAIMGVYIAILEVYFCNPLTTMEKSMLSIGMS